MALRAASSAWDGGPLSIWIASLGVSHLIAGDGARRLGPRERDLPIPCRRYQIRWLRRGDVTTRCGPRVLDDHTACVRNCRVAPARGCVPDRDIVIGRICIPRCTHRYVLPVVPVCGAERYRCGIKS